MRELLAELRRRNVFRAAAFYAAAGWLLVQVATQVFPFFAVPNWTVRAIVIATVLGFPFAMLFSWLYEWTPQGFRRESEVAAGQSITRQTGKRLDRWIIAILSLAVVLLLVDRLVVRDDGPRVIAGSVAVIPLVDESGDPASEYFSDGLSEELISALGRIPGLKVIGRNSSFQFKNRHADSKSIGHKLGVATLLEGTVRKQGDRVRIVAELISVADNRQLWTQTYDRQLKDLFAIQSDIAQAVAGALKVTLLGGSASARPRASSASVQAHNAYLEGHFYFERHNREGYRKAIRAFDEAIRMDPNYALAYAERAIAWSWIGDVDANSADVARVAARKDAERAAALDPSLAEAHAALGWVRYFVDWNFDAALTELRRAEQLAPGNARNKDVLSHVLLRTGRIDEAGALVWQAVELDPLAFETRNDLARVLAVQGRLADAAAQGRVAAELQPTGVASHRWQVIAAVLQGDGEGALHEAGLEPNRAFRSFETALAQDARGDRSAADAELNGLIAEFSTSMAYQIAEAYAFRGDAESAFAWLQRAYFNRDAGILGMLVDPLLRGLRGDPRFNAMLLKVGLPLTATKLGPSHGTASRAYPARPARARAGA